MALFTKAGILHAEVIFGPNPGALKGKNNKKTPERVTMNSITYFLEGLLEQQGYAPLAVDVMYINENLFSYDHVNNPTNLVQLNWSSMPNR